MTRRLSPLVICLVAASALSAQTAVAKPHLGTVKPVTDGIMAVGIANMIRKRCPDISARMIKAYFYINKLENHAKSLGYTRDEIDAYLNDKDEEAKIIEQGMAFLRTQGVDPEKPDTLCAFGRDEIAKSSLIGSFLRAN